MKFNKIYTVNFGQLAVLLTPTFLRKNRMMAWLTVLLAPLQIVHSDFLKYRKKVNYKLRHNSQVCYLQAVLNDEFDNGLRRIRITNGRFIPPLYIYAPQEKRPVYLGTQYLYSPEDIKGAQTDFIVQIPKDLKPANAIEISGFTSDIKALTNEYKLASKTYIIQWTN